MVQNLPAMSVFVSMFAIQSRLDFFIKPPLFLGSLVAMVVSLEWMTTPTGQTEPILELIPPVLIGGSILTILFFSVVTHQFRLQRHVLLMAMTDELTQLPNRRHFLSQVQDRLKAGKTGYIMLADADHFKKVNDSYGHAAGDECLKAIAARIRETVGDEDLFGRLGGEEFGVFMQAHSVFRLRSIGANLAKEITITLAGRDEPVQINFTLSVGTAEAATSVPVEKVLHRADVALYAAKAQGRARMIDWEPAMEDPQERQTAMVH